LEAIRFGDKPFFDRNPELDETPIVVNFNSSDPQFNKTEKWNKIGDYKLQKN